jgi:Uma2 family endonuclease
MVVMPASALKRLTVEQFHEWADARAASLGHDEPKWELFNGIPEMHSSQRWIQARLKVQIYDTFRAAIQTKQLALDIGLDGVGVQIGERNEYIPEVVIFPAGSVGDNERQTREPRIVVEVLSPSTRYSDLSTKLAGYTRVPSIAHYLVVDPDVGEVLHFRRRGARLTRPRQGLRDGELRLVPPGLTLTIRDFAAETLTDQQRLP